MKRQTEYKLILKNLNQDNMKIVVPDDATAAIQTVFKTYIYSDVRRVNYRYNGIKER